MAPSPAPKLAPAGAPPERRPLPTTSVPTASFRASPEHPSPVNHSGHCSPRPASLLSAPPPQDVAAPICPHPIRVPQQGWCRVARPQATNQASKGLLGADGHLASCCRRNWLWPVPQGTLQLPQKKMGPGGQGGEPLGAQSPSAPTSSSGQRALRLQPEPTVLTPRVDSEMQAPRLKNGIPRGHK